MVDRSELDRILAGAEPSELFALAGELQGRAIAAVAATPPLVARVGATLPDESLSAEEAAQRLGVSLSWLYKTTKAGQIPFATRLGRRLVYSARGLEGYRAARRVA